MLNKNRKMKIKNRDKIPKIFQLQSVNAAQLRLALYILYGHEKFCQIFCALRHNLSCAVMPAFIQILKTHLTTDF